jgi:protein O-mannosyl-transferase
MVKTSRQDEAVAISPPLNERWLVASMLMVTALVYAAAVRFEFVYDDHGQIVENALIRSWRFVPQYFRGQVWQYLYPDASASYYRPLNVLWFRINDALFGLHPAGWHVLAILLHVVATYLAYCVARRLTATPAGTPTGSPTATLTGRLTGRPSGGPTSSPTSSLTGSPLVALLAALLFGVHPMRHEVVAWVSGTTESLWSVLFFSAFLAYLRSRENRRILWMGLSCALFSAALLSKETAMVLPIVVFAHAWIYAYSADRSSPEANEPDHNEPDHNEPDHNEPEDNWRRGLKAGTICLAYLPVAAAYLFLRVAALHGFSHPAVHISARIWMLTLPSVLFFYVRQWLLPLQIAEFYDLPLLRSFNIVHVLLPALAILFLGGALWFLRGKLGRRVVEFAAIWTVVTLLPAFDFAVFPPGELVHDRYFYLPSFGASLILALALGQLAAAPAMFPAMFRLPQAWLLASLALLVPLCYGTARAAKFWINDYALFEHAYRVAPANLTARNDYAIELVNRGDYGTAIPIMKQLLAEHPDNWGANFNFGRLFYKLGMYPQAETYFDRARSVRPAVPETYQQLALVYLRTGHPDQAEANLLRAVDLQPLNASFRFALGVVLAQRADCAAARAQFSEALLLTPGFSRAQEQMAKCGAAAGPPDRVSPAQAAARPPRVDRGVDRAGDRDNVDRAGDRGVVRAAPLSPGSTTATSR